MGAREEAAFGIRLRGYRQLAGLSQEELAERAGLTTKAISALERGERRRPYPSTVRAIAAALGLPDADRASLIAAVPSRDSPAGAQAEPSGTGAPSRLPAGLPSLLGRDEELSLVRGQLLADEVRLLTLVGPGGVGKTSLATAAANSLAGDAAFPDGVWFVDLSATTDPRLVIGAIGRTIGALDGGTTLPVAGLASFLARRRLLVILDNFEQVLGAAADVAQLLAAGSGATFLVTSRETLRLRWERTIPLQPLALPDPRHMPPVEELAVVPAVALFVERARASAPSFTLTTANATPVAELCVRLDGLPLAIELVAARAAQLGPEMTLDRLARRLPVPGSTLRDAPARQQSLQATIEWSLDLLDGAERRLFHRLAVFAGGWTVPAADAVAGDLPVDVLSGLASLADKNLIVVDPADRDGPRFRMLDTARAIALDHLEASGDAGEIRLAHARHFAAFAEAASAELQGATQAAAVERLEREEDNFRQALDWARRGDRQEALEEGLRLVGALAWYWFLHGYPAEAGAWFEALLGPDTADSRVEPGSPGERAMILRAKALNAAGFRATDQGEYGLAATFHEKALAAWRRLDDVPGLVNSLHGVGDTALWLGDTDTAETSYRDGLALAESRGTPEHLALFAFHLGQLAWLTGRLDEAAEFGESALRVAEAAGSTTWPPYALFVLASIAHEHGRTNRAGELYRESIRRGWEHHDRLCIRMVLPGLAALATLEGDPVRALRLAGAASSLEENAGIWAFPPIRERHERWFAAARAALDEGARAAAWEEGRAMGIDDVIADALRAPDPGTPRPVRGTAGGLSAREREVLELLVRGRSNREIAAELFVTEHTAKYHVASLFNKLGVSNRAEAVSRAIALGVAQPPTD